MRPFLERYPDFLRRSPEFRDLQEAVEPELLELWAARDSAMEQLCVETADWGLSFWERTLGLPVEAGKALNARRGMVRSRLMGAGVTTVAAVESLARLHSGVPVKAEEFPGEFRVELLFDDGGFAHHDLAGLTAELREIMPAHLTWSYQFQDGCEAGLAAGAACAGSGTVDGAWAPRY